MSSARGAAGVDNLKGGIKVVGNRILPDLNFHGVIFKKEINTGASNNKCHGFYGHLVA